MVGFRTKKKEENPLWCMYYAISIASHHSFVKQTLQDKRYISRISYISDKEEPAIKHAVQSHPGRTFQGLYSILTQILMRFSLIQIVGGGEGGGVGGFSCGWHQRESWCLFKGYWVNDGRRYQLRKSGYIGKEEIFGFWWVRQLILRISLVGTLWLLVI